jgi:hypothetical protein
MKDYLTFHKEKRILGKKTDRYLVRHRYDATILGEIRFHGAWRQFVFYPETDTYFASSCLLQINNFLLELNFKWRKKK